MKNDRILREGGDKDYDENIKLQKGISNSSDLSMQGCGLWAVGCSLLHAVSFFWLDT
jgi:hypothetical protein